MEGKMYMEFRYLGASNDEKMTGMKASFDTDDHTKRMFEHYKTMKAEIKSATFLLDLRKPDCEIVDTIALDDAGFENITGKKPESAEYYENVDRTYWKMAIEQVGGKWPSKSANQAQC